MNQQKKNITFLYTAILYLCGFFLFLEWLYPLETISDTSNIMVFIIYTFFCFFISVFQLKWWLGFLLKGLALLFILNGLYFEGTFLSVLWMEQLNSELSYNLQALFDQQWYYLTPIFRSFLFLILIWLMSYLLHYWFVQMKRVFLFIILSFIYLTILDTFTAYDASMPIIRTFIMSFIALGIANLVKEVDKESIRFVWAKNSMGWMAPLILIVLLSAVVGFAAPKAEPQWPDPVPFIYSASKNAGSGKAGIQKVGYGEDDSNLGGSFIQDDTPVFNAFTTEDHYWRIETKDMYTGQGWVTSADPSYELQTEGAINLDTFAEGIETETVQAAIEFHGDEAINKLVYPYGISEAEGIAGVEFYLDTQSDAIEGRVNGTATNLTSYQLTYDNPSFEINALRENTEDDPADITERYTQTPDAFPERVGSLAEEITAGYESRYDKVKAVERYFSSNDFEYRTTDIPDPSEDEDYVDQFLFETQAGYCDNFSTSMVVMLRTLDIPARWVKGFTSGEIIDNEGETDIYQVKNSNAHSWVEVYFPESGWVPFEPTKGFSNLSDFYVEFDPDAEAAAEEEEPEVPELERPEQPEPELPEEDSASAETQANTASFSIKWWQIAIALAVAIAIGITVYKTRFRWQTKAITARLHNQQDAKTFQDAYHHLMKLLNHYGYGKAPDQTLREFAEQIDTHYASNEMRRLTNSYEQMIYRNDISQLSLNELTQLWKNLIKRIMG